MDDGGTFAEFKARYDAMRAAYGGSIERMVGIVNARLWDEGAKSLTHDGFRDAMAAMRRPYNPATTIVVSPAMCAGYNWLAHKVMPREARGEYVPADEQHPPVTAAELRGRLVGTVGDG